MADRPIVDNKMQTQERRSLRRALRLTPQERVDRFVELQRRANQLLALSPEGGRRFFARNLRQRRIHAPS